MIKTRKIKTRRHPTLNSFSFIFHVSLLNLQLRTFNKEKSNIRNKKKTQNTSGKFCHNAQKKRRLQVFRILFLRISSCRWMNVLTKTLNLASLCFAFGTNTSTWWGWWASKTEHSFVKKNWMWKQEIDEHIALRIQNSFDVNEVNMGRVRWGQVKQSGVARDSFREIWCFLMRNESWDAFGREWIYFHHWSVRQFTGSGKNEKTPNVRGTKILTERSRWRPRPTYLKSPKLSLIIRWRMITCAEFDDSRKFSPV